MSYHREMVNKHLTVSVSAVRISPFICDLGMSATARKRKEEVAQALKKLIQAKGKTPAMKYQQLLDDLRGQSETVSIFICLAPLCVINSEFRSRFHSV